VDDNADVRLTARDQIASLGYVVTEADSGDAALALLEARPGAFDLVFTDLVMPGQTDGLALAGIVRTRWPAVAILLTSGFAGEPDDADDLDASDFEFLRKPYRKPALAAALRHALSFRREAGAPGAMDAQG
jgi:CheY-like chemotaxis protein